MPLIKKFILVKPMKFLILFLILIHTITLGHNIIIYNYNF
jgi:hypothetical protein